MTQRLDEAAVRRIAALAHLELSTDEVDLFSKQLTDILAYVAELQAIDTTGIPPTSHPHATEPVWRDDTSRPSLDRDVVLSRASDASVRAGLFKVPKVL